MGLRKILGLKKRRKLELSPAGPMKAGGAPKDPSGRPRLSPLDEQPDFAAWFEGKEFSADWLSKKVAPWFSALEPWRQAPAEILEVGSYEGRSAIVFLNYLPQSRVTCVDTFGLEDVTARTAGGHIVEQRFDRNLLPFGERVIKFKSFGAAALDRMRSERAKYDIIYLDADKQRDGVFALTALAWPLLRVNGILIWDDLRWGREKPDADRPESAIRLFCSAFSRSLSILHDDRQMIIRKTSDWPTD